MAYRLKKADLVELKSMNNPPEAVKLVLYSVLVLLGSKEPTWKEAKLLMGDIHYINKIMSLDRDQIDMKTLERLKTYTTNPIFNARTMKCISKGTFRLYDFVKETEFYATKLNEYTHRC